MVDMAKMVEEQANENGQAYMRLRKAPSDFPRTTPLQTESIVDPIQEKTPEEEKYDFLDDLMSIPKQIVGGATDAVVEQTRAVRDVAEWGVEFLGVETDTDPDILDKIPSIAESGGGISRFARVMTQFMVGMAGPAKFLKLGKMAYKGASIVRGAVAGGLSGATAFDPNDPNAVAAMRDLARKFEVGQDFFNSLPKDVQKIIEMLPDQPGDSPMMMRTKAFFAEALVGIPFDAVITAARTWRASKSADRILKENMEFDEKSIELRDNTFGPNQPLITRGPAQDTVRKGQEATRAHEAEFGTEKELQAKVDELNKIEGQLESSKKQWAKEGTEVSPENQAVFDALAVEIKDARQALGHSRNLAKFTKKDMKKAREEIKKQQDVLTDPKTGFFKGSEQFVHALVHNGKPFKLTDLGFKPGDLQFEGIKNTESLAKVISKIVKAIDFELTRGTVFGSTKLKQTARAVVGDLKNKLAEEGGTALVKGLAKGAKNPEEALAIEILRAVSGNSIYGMMKKAMKGNVDAIAGLPAALARGAEIEMLARESSGNWFRKGLTSKEIQRQIQRSEFGAMRDFNAKASKMMHRMAESVPGADGVDVAIRLNALQTPAQFKALMKAAGDPTTFDMFLEYFYNAFLSSQDAIINSGVGSHLFLLSQFPVRGMAAVIGHVDKWRMGNPKFGDEDVDHASFSALNAGLAGYFKSTANNLYPLLKNMLKTMATLEPKLKFQEQKIEKFKLHAIDPETGVMPTVIGAIDKIVRFSSQDAISIKDPMKFLVHASGRIMRVVQNSYATFDEFNKQIAADFEKYYQAQLIVDKAGLDVAKSKKLFDEMIERPPAEIKELSQRFADMIAFTEKLDGNADAFRRFVDDFPVMRLMFPLLRSMASMFNSFLRSTPAGLMLPAGKQAMIKGGIDKQIAISQAMFGTMVISHFAKSWYNGDVTGSRVRDSQVSKEMEHYGLKYESFKVSGDSWVVHAMNAFSPTKSMAGKVTRVDDADTLTIDGIMGDQHVIRLKNVDADEKTQALGPQAGASLSKMLLGKNVSVEWRSKGSFGRVIGDVYLDGKLVNKAIIEEEGVTYKPNPPRYISYSNWEPFATGIRTMVNTFEGLTNIWDPDVTRNALQIMGEDVGSNILNRHYAKGVFSILDGLNNGGGDDWAVNLSKVLTPRIATEIANRGAGHQREITTYDPNLTPGAKLLEELLRPIKATNWNYRADTAKYFYGNCY